MGNRPTIDLEFTLSSCVGKEGFESFGMARKIQHRRAGMWDRNYARGAVYHCRVCHRFHIGTKPKKRSGRPVDRKRDRYGEVRI